MEERKACALLKARFEAAGFHIAENVMFEEDHIRFEIDGYDAAVRVGYEYITEEAGDSWDFDDDVLHELAERRAVGDLFVLVVKETEAPDAASVGRHADEFIAALPKLRQAAKETVKRVAAAKKQAAKKPAAKPAAKPVAKKAAKK